MTNRHHFRAIFLPIIFFTFIVPPSSTVPSKSDESVKDRLKKLSLTKAIVKENPIRKTSKEEKEDEEEEQQHTKTREVAVPHPKEMMENHRKDGILSRVKVWFFQNDEVESQSSSGFRDLEPRKDTLKDYINTRSKDLRNMNVWMPQSM